MILSPNGGESQNEMLLPRTGDQHDTLVWSSGSLTAALPTIYVNLSRQGRCAGFSLPCLSAYGGMGGN